MFRIRILFLFWAILIQLETATSIDERDREYFKISGDTMIFKDERAYFAYTDYKKIPRILIIGAGRGRREDYSGVDNYAAAVYGSKAYNFLLVDWYDRDEMCDIYDVDYTIVKLGVSTFNPDIVCDVRKLTKNLSIAQYDQVIFEFLPFGEIKEDTDKEVNVEFFTKAVSEALDLLRPGGFLITNIPTVTKTDNYINPFRALQNFSKKITLSEFYGFYNIAARFNSKIQNICIKRITPSSKHPQEWPFFCQAYRDANDSFYAFKIQKK